MELKQSGAIWSELVETMFMTEVLCDLNLTPEDIPGIKDGECFGNAIQRVLAGLRERGWQFDVDAPFDGLVINRPAPEGRCTESDG